MTDKRFFVQENCGKCPYLPDRGWRILLHAPPRRMGGSDYDRFLAKGWRRNGFFLYKNTCGACSECVPMRLDVSKFRPNRSQSRALRANSSIRVEISESEFSLDDFLLFSTYSQTRHPNGPEINIDNYISSFVETCVDSRIVRYYDGDSLAGVAWTDFAEDSLNCVYFAFDTARSRKGLGVYSIMRHVELCRELGKSYLYLGFYVAGCRKMSYKANYRPHELLLGRKWEPR